MVNAFLHSLDMTWLLFSHHCNHWLILYVWLESNSIEFHTYKGRIVIKWYISSLGRFFLILLYRGLIMKVARSCTFEKKQHFTCHFTFILYITSLYQYYCLVFSELDRTIDNMNSSILSPLRVSDSCSYTPFSLVFLLEWPVFLFLWYSCETVAYWNVLEDYKYFLEIYLRIISIVVVWAFCLVMWGRIYIFLFTNGLRKNYCNYKFEKWKNKIKMWLIDV